MITVDIMITILKDGSLNCGYELIPSHERTVTFIDKETQKEETITFRIPNIFTVSKYMDRNTFVYFWAKKYKKEMDKHNKT